MRLNKTNIQRIKLPAKGYAIYRDDALPGFGLRVTATGGKAFIVERRINGKNRRLTLGRFGVLTADQARKRAAAAIGKMADGIDPIAERVRKRSESVTLREVLESYLTDRRHLKERTKRDIRYQVDRHFTTWADRPVIDITREKVKHHFRRMSDKGPAQANLAYRYLRSLLNYARAEYRTANDEPLLRENPVSVLSETKSWNKSKARNTYVPLDRLGEWWSALQKMRNGTAAPDVLTLICLTGLRLGEAQSLRWVQVDGASIKLTDTKSREDVILPLSDGAAELIQGRGHEGDYIFPAARGGGHVVECRLPLEALGKQTGIRVTPHDLRRTFRAVAAACHVELWRTKALMNHRQSDVTLAHYTDLSDVRYLKPEADAISNYYRDAAKAYKTGNVVSIRNR